MVHTLSDNGANSIWEHSLLDPSNSKINRRKPQPKDLLQLVFHFVQYTTFIAEYIIFFRYLLMIFEMNQI